MRPLIGAGCRATVAAVLGLTAVQWLPVDSPALAALAVTVSALGAAVGAWAAKVS